MLPRSGSSGDDAGNAWSRSHPRLAELKQNDTAPGDLLAAAPTLLNRGQVIKSLWPVQKMVGEPVLPYLFEADLVDVWALEGDDQRFLRAAGKGLTPAEAKVAALGEAVESYSALGWGYDQVAYARREALGEQALDPYRLGLYLPDQYEHLPYTPYREQNTLGWVKARSLTTDQEIFVPALAALAAYKPHPNEFICQATSSGLATGPTLAEAILRAAGEVIERDAFVITWLNRLPCQRVEPEDHPNPEIGEMCRAYQQAGVTFLLFRLPTDQPLHVFMAAAMQGSSSNQSEGPAATVGLAAGMAAGRAAQQAILEAAQIRTGLRRYLKEASVQRYMAGLAAYPHLVNNKHDHALRYAGPAALQAFDFLLDCSPSAFDWEVQTAERQTASANTGAVCNLEILINSLQSSGHDLIYCNLTPPDMLELGLHTVRVILPGFQPIHFGRRARRLANQRLYELPYRLGLTQSRSEPRSLNQHPHPLA